MSARYVPLVKIASGGMATVYVGAARGDLGFRRLVAIKRPHPHIAEDPELRAALIEEAHVAARVRHANVAGVQDVEVAGDDVQLVMDYVEGATLGQLLGAASKRGEKLPAKVVLRIALDACAGLAAVHEARDDSGAPLGLVHRDVSPQNLLIGLDGLSRISDFGTAKSALSGRQSTTQGTLKGKLAYMAPEYVGRGRLDHRVDVFAMGVVLWEALAGKRLFRGTNDADTLDRVQREEAPPLREVAPELGDRLGDVVARALQKRPEDRWATAEELGAALAEAAQDGERPASHAEVARVVREAVEPALETRRAEVRERLAEMDAPAGSSASPASHRSLGAPVIPAPSSGGASIRSTPSERGVPRVDAGGAPHVDAGARHADVGGAPHVDAGGAPHVDAGARHADVGGAPRVDIGDALRVEEGGAMAVAREETVTLRAAPKAEGLAVATPGGRAGRGLLVIGAALVVVTALAVGGARLVAGDAGDAPPAPGAAGSAAGAAQDDVVSAARDAIAAPAGTAAGAASAAAEDRAPPAASATSEPAGVATGDTAGDTVSPASTAAGAAASGGGEAARPPPGAASSSSKGPGTALQKAAASAPSAPSTLTSAAATGGKRKAPPNPYGSK